MRLFLNNDALVAEWVRQHIPHMDGCSFGACSAIGITTEEGDMLGGVVFSNYHKKFRWMEVSVASVSPRWLTPRIITEIMRYPFQTAGLKRLQSHAPRRNKAACDFNRRLGFKQEGTLRRAVGGDDAVVFGMLDTDWRRSRFNLDRVNNLEGRTRPAAAH